jgi:hypothetical protein
MLAYLPGETVTPDWRHRMDDGCAATFVLAFWLISTATRRVAGVPGSIEQGMAPGAAMAFRRRRRQLDPGRDRGVGARRLPVFAAYLGFATLGARSRWPRYSLVG